MSKTDKKLPDHVYAALVAFRAIHDRFPELLPTDKQEIAQGVVKKLFPYMPENEEGTRHVIEGIFRILRDAVSEKTVVPESPGNVVLTHRTDDFNNRELIAVTRQDEEGRILSVIWEKPQ